MMKVIPETVKGALISISTFLFRFFLIKGCVIGPSPRSIGRRTCYRGCTSGGGGGVYASLL